jgi:uncharacterized protein (DUF427 family)
MKATWRDAILAESDKTIVIEDNHYFPPSSIKGEFFSPSETHTTCPWKGIASDQSNADAAWYEVIQFLKANT